MKKDATKLQYLLVIYSIKICLSISLNSLSHVPFTFTIDVFVGLTILLPENMLQYTLHRDFKVSIPGKLTCLTFSNYASNEM
jgi:hypothetical protein